jgi:hypothetical protein
MRKILLKADLGICPGAVGLSVLHLAWHGLPVVTVEKNLEHGPEINYLIEEVNAFFLKDLSHDEFMRILEFPNNFFFNLLSLSYNFAFHQQSKPRNGLQPEPR